MPLRRHGHYDMPPSTPLMLTRYYAAIDSVTLLYAAADYAITPLLLRFDIDVTLSFMLPLPPFHATTTRCQLATPDYWLSMAAKSALLPIFMIFADATFSPFS